MGSRCLPAWAVLLAGSCGVQILAAGQDLSYVDLGAGDSACCLVPDPAGGVYVVGRDSRQAGGGVSVTHLNSAQEVVAHFSFGGGGFDEPRAAALDPQGHLVIAGQTGSPDFPLVNALITETEPNAPAGFIIKVVPSTGAILFSTRVGGLAAETNRIGSAVNAIAIDSQGAIFAAGRTNAPDFPVSPDAFRKTGAGGDPFGPRPFGFVLKMASQGDRLVYSTLLGGSRANCQGGSHCIGKYSDSSITAIAVDASGNVTVGGSTNASDFPVTAGAFQTVCRCQEHAGNGFVARLNASGSNLIWSTLLGGSAYGFTQVPYGTNSVRALWLDPAGSVIVGGLTDTIDFPTTPNALQPEFAGSSDPVSRHDPDGYLARLNAAGSALLFSTYFGGSGADEINDVQVDASGNIWVTGTSDSVSVAGRPASLIGSYFAALDPEGSTLLAFQDAPAGAAGQSIRMAADGSLRVLGATGSLLRVPEGPGPQSAILGVASSAGGAVKGRIAPGEFVSFYGTGLGPDPGIGAKLDENGRIATGLAGVRVLFDGVPAPLLYVSGRQINALVPYGVSARRTVRAEITGGASAAQVNLFTAAAQPEVFRNGDRALALNQDGSLNSAENPAAPNSIVTIFASGAGSPANPPPDGSIATVLGFGPMLPVTVLLNRRSVEVTYAGAAPGLVANTLQVNFRQPNAGAGLYQLIVGGFASGYFSVFVE